MSGTIQYVLVEISGIHASQKPRLANYGHTRLTAIMECSAEAWSDDVRRQAGLQSAGRCREAALCLQ